MFGACWLIFIQNKTLHNSVNMTTALDFKSFTGRQWENVGTAKRAGVLAPLFCLHSKLGVGIGEIPDLLLLADWCEKTGISMIQILPLNDTGWDFRPYDSQSAFAIDPMYLRLSALKAAAVSPFKQKLADLAKEFSSPKRFVDYRVKSRKLELLWQIFHHPRTDKKSSEFLNFMECEKSWLGAYAAFKVLKHIYQNKPWWLWPIHLRVYDPQAIEKELASLQGTVLFHKWLAWQTFTQLEETVQKIRSKNILVMADMPFLVSRDSADVWMNPRFFKLDREAGAPPDLYIAEGQRWGMPPYRWQEIEVDHFRYLKDRIRLMGRYAHLYRIDHFVGLCRLWCISSDEPRATHGKNGAFDPADESLWKKQAEGILHAMIEASDMLPCAEDLGVVPDCAYEILNDFQIPGSDVQRWMRDWKGDKHFKSPEDYRFLSMSSLSTHDMSSFPLWWTREATDEDKSFLLDWMKVSADEAHKSFPDFLEKVFEKVLSTKSVFSIHALQDWLGLSGDEEFFKADHRVNEPGTVQQTNWSVRAPFSLEEMLLLPINAKIRRLIENSGRKV